MNPLALIPGPWKLAAAGVAVLALIGLLGTAAAVIEKRGYDKATATLQPKLDKANAAIGTLTAANDHNLKTIATMTADAAANDALVEQYAAQQAADTQKAADAAAAIRKLQSDDQTVDAYLRTPIPVALRRVLADAGAGGDAGAADHGGAAAAAH